MCQGGDLSHPQPGLEHELDEGHIASGPTHEARRRPHGQGEHFTTPQRERLWCPGLAHEPEMGRGVFGDPVAVESH